MMTESNNSHPTDSDDQQEIEAAFFASWDFIVEFYNGLFWGAPEWLALHKTDPSWVENSELYERMKTAYDWLKPILGLIAEMRQRGYERQLRAGQRLLSFVLSRSRNHGLRGNQDALLINVHIRGGMEINYWSTGKSKEKLTLEQKQIALTPELEQLLARLLEQPIDEADFTHDVSHRRLKVLTFLLSRSSP